MTSSLIILLIALTLNNLMWGFLFLYLKDKDSKQEEKRFREYAIATKAYKLDDYVAAIPDNDAKMPEKQDEIMELSEADPGDLLMAIKQSNENH